MFRRNRTATIEFYLFLLVACWSLSSSARAEEAPEKPAAVTQGEQAGAADDIELGTSDGFDVRVGLGGAWKLGHVCPVRVDVPEQYAADLRAVEIGTIDGDGVEVVYRREVQPTEAGRPQKVWVPIRIGGRSVTLQVRLLGESGVLIERDVDPYVQSVGYASTQPLVLAIGSSMGVEELARRSADGGGKTFSTVVVDNAEQLPLTFRDYSACDIIVVSASDLALLGAIGSQQWAAIDEWIRHGGGCVISLGPSADQLKKVPSLVDMLPGELIGEGRVTNPAGLESLVITDEPLRPFPVTLLDVTQRTAKVELSLLDSVSRRAAWWVSYPRGHGTVQLIASGLGGESLNEWKDRRVLWEKLIQPYFAKEIVEGNSAASAVGASSYLGYDDLVGQLRATLDVFSSVQVVSFGQVAAILVGVLLLIGPLDYFVSVKWLKRPELSWYFAGAMLVAVSTALVFLHRAIRPDDVLLNTAQIVDVDGSTGEVYGRLWSHVYSGNAQQLDINAKTQAGEPVFLDWQGLPGRGLGGLQSQLSTDRGMPEYAIEITGDGGSALQSVGIPSAGTKCLTGEWTQTIPLAGDSDLQQMVGVDQLQGELVNPLPVDLKDAVLYYHNWYYVLNSRIAPGERLAVSSETIPKGIARRLNRQRNVDGKVSATRWNPAERDQPDRLLELMMFYKAASGRNYTSLSNRYQPQVDQSNLLETDLALLIGQVDVSPVELDVQTQAGVDAIESDDGEKGMSRVWYRITLPVALPNRG